jgi:riboflavin biosynthesis pyrimidine reductase
VQQIYPADDPVAQGASWTQPGTADLLADRYAYPQAPGAPRPWVRANMVASVDGAAAVSGRSGGLSGPADHLLFQVLRSLADVIVVGAGTVRAEKYLPARQSAMLPALREGRTVTPPIAVVTGSLHLDPESSLLTQAPADARTIVFTTESAPASLRAAIARHADVIVAGTDALIARQVIDVLAGRGLFRILTEGGPSLLAQIAAEGLLDELCLTISPFLVGGQPRTIMSGGPAGHAPGAPGSLPGAPESLTLAHVLADAGYLFCRYLRSEK